MRPAATARDVPGEVALPGYQVVHVTPRAPIPWRDGFELIDRHLRPEGRPRAALCWLKVKPRDWTVAEDRWQRRISAGT